MSTDISQGVGRSFLQALFNRLEKKGGGLKFGMVGMVGPEFNSRQRVYNNYKLRDYHTCFFTWRL